MLSWAVWKVVLEFFTYKAGSGDSVFFFSIFNRNKEEKEKYIRSCILSHSVLWHPAVNQ